MNYLGHYALNHRVRGLPREPYFVLGVALPDLWPRFSRSRRIRWRAVRESRPQSPAAAGLRAGLLNHVEADAAFHMAPVFVAWLRLVRSRLPAGETHPALADFAAHVAIELVLDRRLTRDEPALAAEFYEMIAACEGEAVERHVGRVGDVDARGLGRQVELFAARRFLERLEHEGAVESVVEHVLSLVADGRHVSPGLVAAAVAEADRLVRPEAVWAALEPRRAAACG